MTRIAAIIVLACIACADAGRAAAPEIGHLAPALEATELNGRTFDLAAERGKVVIVNFWATWCGPCRAEMPALDAFYRSFRADGLAIIGLSVDRWSDRARVAAMMRQYSYPAAMLNEARIDDFPRPREIPVTYIVDRDGVLRAIRHGMTATSLAETVLPLLRAKAPPSVPPGMSASRD